MRAAILVLCLLCTPTSAFAQVGAIAPSRAPDLTGLSLAATLSSTLARTGPLSQHDLSVDAAFSAAAGCGGDAVLRPICAAARARTGLAVGTLTVQSRTGLIEERRATWPGLSAAALWSPLHFEAAGVTISPVVQVAVEGLGAHDPEADAPLYDRRVGGAGLVIRAPKVEIGAQIGEGSQPEGSGLGAVGFTAASFWGRWCVDAGAFICAEFGGDAIFVGELADERLFGGLVAHQGGRAVGVWFLGGGGPGSPVGLVLGVEAGL